MAQSTLTWGAALLVLLSITARRVAGDPTPFDEDDCRNDNAIRYDGDIFVDGMRVNENRTHLFDLGSVRQPHTQIHSLHSPHIHVMYMKQSTNSNTLW